MRSLPDDESRKALSGQLASALAPLVISGVYELPGMEGDESEGRKKKPLPDVLSDYRFALDIVGNTICADLIDYLRRDHLFTGLPAEFGRRFLEGFYVSRSDHQYYPCQMIVRIAKGGHLRADVISELFKFLRYRYELSERALTHHAKLSADAMVGKLLEMWRDLLWIQEAGRRVDRHFRSSIELAAVRREIATQFGSQADRAIQRIERSVRRRLESELTAHGDEGFLELLRERSADKSGRWGAVHGLSADLLDRRLYKGIGECASARANARSIYSTHREPEARKRLEKGAAHCAELDSGWHVVVWIPPPQMRMKAARVLVDDGNMLAPLDDYDKAGAKRGLEIYDSHAALWRVRVFVHRSVIEDHPEKVPIVLAYLGEKLGIGWDEERRRPSLVGLAVERVAKRRGLSEAGQAELLDRALRVSLAAKSQQGPTARPALADPTESVFSQLTQEVELLVPD